MFSTFFRLLRAALSFIRAQRSFSSKKTPLPAVFPSGAAFFYSSDAPKALTASIRVRRISAAYCSSPEAWIAQKIPFFTK